MNKTKHILTALLLTLSLCACTNYIGRPKTPQIWDKPYVTRDDAEIWAQNSDIRHLCFGLKNWKSENVIIASEIELKKRNISAKTCYSFEGFDLSETFN